MFYKSTKTTSPKGETQEEKSPDTFLNTVLVIGTVAVVTAICECISGARK